MGVIRFASAARDSGSGRGRATDSEHEILVGLATTLFPADGPIPVDGLAGRVPETVARYLAGFSPAPGRALRLALRAMDASALLSPRHRRLRRLAPESRQRFAASAAAARLWQRLPFLALKQLTGWHPMGTRRMRRSPEHGAVGARGEAFGAPGLYIADASVLPTCAGVNPQVAIVAMATRTAEHLIADVG